jgi:hypothetical protein
MALIGTSPYTLSNVVAHEYATEHGFCRLFDGATVNVASETALTVGSVLGKVTASGKYVPRDPDAVDGSEVAAAVVLENITVAAATDTQVNVIVRGPAILKKGGLVFDVAHDAAQQATAISEIEALGILVR